MYFRGLTIEQVIKLKSFIFSGMIQLIPGVTSGFSPEGAEQALIIGYSIALSPKPHESYGWHVDAAIDGAEVHVDMEVMVWSDIVRRWMASCIFDTHIQILSLWS